MCFSVHPIKGHVMTIDSFTHINFDYLANEVSVRPFHLKLLFSKYKTGTMTKRPDMI